jgi:GNAT superfamily N-acetyltransferase
MTPPAIVIREATAADESIISDLDTEARSEGRRHRGSPHLFESLGTFDERWTNREQVYRFDVAQVDGQIVGFAVVHRRERPLLDQIFVHPQARGLGIGAALLKDTVQRHGAENLDALSLPGDRLTKNLYERAGLKARLIIASSL